MIFIQTPEKEISINLNYVDWDLYKSLYGEELAVAMVGGRALRTI